MLKDPSQSNLTSRDSHVLVHGYKYKPGCRAHTLSFFIGFLSSCGHFFPQPGP